MKIIVQRRLGLNNDISPGELSAELSVLFSLREQRRSLAPPCYRNSPCKGNNPICRRDDHVASQDIREEARGWDGQLEHRLRDRSIDPSPVKEIKSSVSARTAGTINEIVAKPTKGSGVQPGARVKK